VIYNTQNKGLVRTYLEFNRTDLRRVEYVGLVMTPRTSLKWLLAILLILFTLTSKSVDSLGEDLLGKQLDKLGKFFNSGPFKMPKMITGDDDSTHYLTTEMFRQVAVACEKLDMKKLKKIQEDYHYCYFEIRVRRL